MFEIIVDKCIQCIIECDSLKIVPSFERSNISIYSNGVHLYSDYFCQIIFNLDNWFQRRICSLKGIFWKQRIHQKTETRVCIFSGPD